MKQVFLVFAFVLLSAFLFSFSSASDVVVLTDETFEQQTQSASGATSGDWLVEFYAPWCGHCKRLEPIWEQVATQLKGKVNVAKVNVDENKKLGGRFKIQRFPTIKFIRGGQIYSFEDERSLDAITRFATGGYSTKSGESVPALPNALEEFVHTVTPYALIAQQYAQRGLQVAQVYATQFYNYAKVEIPHLYRLARSELDRQGINLDQLDSLNVDEVRNDVTHIFTSKKAAAAVLFVVGFLVTVVLGFAVVVVHWFFQLLCGSSKNKKRTVVTTKTVSTGNTSATTGTKTTTASTKTPSTAPLPKKSPSKLSKTD